MGVISLGISPMGTLLRYFVKEFDEYDGRLHLSCPTLQSD